MQFTCKTCGQIHDTDKLAFGWDAPQAWEALSAETKAASNLTTDLCIINAKTEKHYFVRGSLLVPIQGTGETFGWSVWTSLSEKSLDEMAKYWKDPRRTEYGPYFGWLSNSIPAYPETYLLKTSVHVCKIGIRPLMVLEAIEHPLAVQQREGISAADLEGLVGKLLHGDEQ